MIDIPVNNRKDNEVEELVSRVVEHLKNDVEYREYRSEYCTPIAVARKVMEMFVDKGYHAKFNFFADGRAAYQCFVISKSYCEDVSARMVYSEIIG